MSQATFNSNLEWECKPYTQEDLRVAQLFRCGSLNCGDVYNLEKYQCEGMLAFLLLPKSALQIGLGWFRYIPTFLDSDAEAKISDNRFNVGNNFQMQDDMGLTLLNSVLTAARGSSQQFQHGQLIKFFATKTFPPKAIPFADIDEGQNPFSPDISTSRKYLLSDSHNNSLVDASVTSECNPLAITDEQEEINLSITSLNGPGNSSANFSNNITPKAIRCAGSKRLHSLTESPKESRATYGEREAAWTFIEEIICPTGVPLDFKATITDDYWIKHDPTIRSEKELFSKIISEIFVAMRTPVNRPYSDIDLSLSYLEIGLKAIQKLTTIYNTDPKLISPASILQINQTTWVLGNASASCPLNQLNQLKLKYTKQLKDSANLPGDLFLNSQMVVKMWGTSTPISRMENLSFSFLDILKRLGANGASQISKAIEHLNNRYPNSV